MSFNTPSAHDSFHDVAEMRAFARKLIALWDRDEGRTLSLKVEFADGSGPIIWSYTKHSVELMRTVIDLSEQDRMIVAVPLIRLMVETAMTSIWLYLAPDSVRAVIHEGLRTKRATIDDILKAGARGVVDQEMLDQVKAQMDEFADNALPAGRHFEQRCRAIMDGLSIYGTYRVMSSLSHAGMAMADFYLREAPKTEEAPLGVAFNSLAKLPSHEAWLGTAICMLLATLKACDGIDDEGRRKTQIARAAKKLGLTLDLRLVEGDTGADDEASEEQPEEPDVATA